MLLYKILEFSLVIFETSIFYCQRFFNQNFNQHGQTLKLRRLVTNFSFSKLWCLNQIDLIFE